VTVDTIPPVLTLLSPTNGGFVTTARPSISVSATDALSGVNFATATLTLDTQQVATGTLSYTPPANLSDGLHSLAASVADRAGNVATLSASFTIDTQPPSAAQITGITDGQIIKGTIPITLSATDTGSGVATMDLLVDGNFFTRLVSPFQLNLNTQLISEGTHTLSAQARDNAGNVGTVGQVLHVTVDNVPLTVTITGPASGTDFRNSVTVAAVASKTVQSIQFTLAQQTITSTAAPYTATFDLTGFSDGPQTITATATDSVDAPATTSISIVVKHTPPPAPIQAKILAQVSISGFAQVTGGVGAVTANDTVQITNKINSAVASGATGPDGSFATNISAAVGDTLSIVVVDDVGNVSTPTTVVVSSASSVLLQPLRPAGSVLDTHNLLATSLAALFVMNEGSGTTDVNLVDSQIANFAGPSLPTWNVLDPSIVFNGGAAIGSYLDAGSDLALDQLTTSQTTIVAKVFVNTLTTAGIAEKNDGNATDSGFVFGLDNSGALHLLVERAAQNLRVTTVGGLVPTGQWVQVAFTWDGTVGLSSAAHLFFNGVEQSKATAQDGAGTIGFANATGKPFRIGTGSFEVPGSLNGKMAYLAVYRGRILTPSEMKDLDLQLPITQIPGVTGRINPGSPQNVTINNAAQSANLIFSGKAGQPATVQLSNNTMRPVTVSVLNPGGPALTSQSSSLASFNLPTQVLPVSGNYTIKISASAPGTITVNLVLGPSPSRPAGSTLDTRSPLTRNLAGLFLMNEGSGSLDLNVVDSQAANFSGAGLPTWNVLDPSIVFNGGGALNSYLDAGDDPSFDQLTIGPMTIVAKVYVNTVTSAGVAEKNDGNSLDSGFVFGWDNAGAFHLNVEKSGADMRVSTAGGVIPTGQWAQVAFTWDGTIGTASAAHLFLNGVEQTKTSAGDGTGTIGFANATNRPFRIGTASFEVPGSLNGRMAYLAVYRGRILTTAEMNELDQQMPISQIPGVTGIISSGSPENVAINNPAQSQNLVFSGKAGQPATVQLNNNTMGSVTISVVNPDGTTLESLSSSAASFNLPTQILPSTGAYTINITTGTPGTITVTLYLGPTPSRPAGSTLDTKDPLAANLAGLFVMNEGTGTADLNLADSQTASFSGSTLPSWNVLDPSIVLSGGARLSSYLDAGTDLAFDKLTPGQMTIVAKVYVNQVASAGIAEKNDGNSIDSGFVFGWDSSGALHLNVEKSGPDMRVSTVGGMIPTGQWAQLAFTWDGTIGSAAAAHLFLNGVEQTKASAGDGGGTIGFANATGRPFRIGTASFETPGSINGRMAYLAVYKGRILMPAEMVQLDTQLPLTANNVPLIVSFVSPAPGSAFNSQVKVVAATSKETQRIDFTLGQQKISSTSAPFQASFSLSGVPEGNQTITATAFDFTGNSASANLPIVVDRTPPVAPDNSLIFAEPPIAGLSQVHGMIGSVEPSTTVQVTNLKNGSQALTKAGADGSFSTQITGNEDDIVSVIAIDAAGNLSPASLTSIRRLPSPSSGSQSVSLQFQGLVGDRVGPGRALTPDGQTDAVFVLGLNIGANTTRTLSFIDLSNGSNTHSTRVGPTVVGVAADIASPFLNSANGTVNFSMTGSSTLTLITTNTDNFIQPGLTYTVTALFTDGSRFVGTFFLVPADDHQLVAHTATVTANPPMVTSSAGVSGASTITVSNIRDINGTLVPDGSNIALTVANRASNNGFGDPIPSAGGSITDGSLAPNNANFKVYTIQGGQVVATYTGQPVTPPGLTGSVAVVQMLPADSAGNVIGSEAEATADINVRAPSDRAIGGATPASLYADTGDHRSHVVVQVRDAQGNLVVDGTQIAVSAANGASFIPGCCGIGSAGGAIIGGQPSISGAQYRIFTTTTGSFSFDYSDSGLGVGTDQTATVVIAIMSVNPNTSVNTGPPLGTATITLVGMSDVELSSSMSSVPFTFPSIPVTIDFHDVHDARANLVPDGSTILVSAVNGATFIPGCCGIGSTGGSIADGIASPNNAAFRYYALTGNAAAATYTMDGVGTIGPGSTAIANIQLAMGDPLGRAIDDHLLKLIPITLVAPSNAVGNAQPGSLLGDGGIHTSTVTFNPILDAFGNPLRDGSKIAVSVVNGATFIPGCCGIGSAGGQILSGTPAPNNGAFLVHTVVNGGITVSYADQNLIFSPGQIQTANLQLAEANADGTVPTTVNISTVGIKINGVTSATVSVSPSILHADGGDHRATITVFNVRDASGNVVPDGTLIGVSAANGATFIPGCCGIGSAGGVIVGGTPGPSGFQIFPVHNGQVVFEYSSQGVAFASGRDTANVQVAPVSASGTIITTVNIGSGSIQLLAPGSATVSLSPSDLFSDGGAHTSSITISNLKDSDGVTPVPDGVRIGLSVAFGASFIPGCCGVASAGGQILSAGTTAGDGTVATNNSNFSLFTVVGGQVLATYSDIGVVTGIGQTQTANVQIVPVASDGSVLTTAELAIGGVQLHGINSVTANGPTTLSRSTGSATITFSGIKDSAGHLVPDGTLVVVSAAFGATFIPGCCSVSSVGGTIVDGGPSPSGSQWKVFVVQKGSVTVTYSPAGAGIGTASIQMTGAKLDGSALSNVALSGGIWGINITN